MSNYQKISLEHVKANPQLTGYYEVDIGNNKRYVGKIVNGKKNNFGSIYNGDKLELETFWINNKNIDDVPLPNEITFDEEYINKQLETCQKVKFNYNPTNAELQFSLTYYVPFLDSYDLHHVIDKVVKQTNLSNKELNVTVDRTECDLMDCLYRLFEIDEIQSYISKIDTECSQCVRLNRGWSCCGQFAPFMYIYNYLCFEVDYDRFFSDRFGLENSSKPMQMYSIANVFYKMFTGYASDSKKYVETRNNIADLYGVDIPNVHDEPHQWEVLEWKTDAINMRLDNGVGYLFMLKTENEMIEHFGFITRCNDYVIISDSWAHISHRRMPVLRVMEYNEFMDSIVKINGLFNKSLTTISKEEILLYNFIMDSLFLVPYNLNDIKNGAQTFQPNELVYFTIVDPRAIDGYLNELDRRSNEPFNMYFNMGGSKRSFKRSDCVSKRSNCVIKKKRTKKRNNKKRKRTLKK